MEQIRALIRADRYAKGWSGRTPELGDKEIGKKVKRNGGDAK